MHKRARWAGIVCIPILVVMAMIISIAGSPANVLMAQTEKGGEFYAGKTPKYVFMFIGDGMSYAQVSSAEMYLGNKAKPSGYPTPKHLNFSNFPVHGAATTYDSSSFVPDSASTATSLASGYKTLSAVINMDESKTKKYRPITYDLQAMEYKIGIITSVPIDHATPAAYYASVPHRGQVDSIAQQLAASGFDFFGGGGFQGNVSQVEKSIGYAETAGYTFANTMNDILALDNKSGKVLAISPVLDGAALNYELDRDKEKELSLADFVKKGIEVLDNRKGFFMMVESGKIDWANHANDAAASIHDTVAFADAIEEALKVYRKHPKDTLIIVTGDHECGGMTIGYAGTKYETFFEKIKPVTMSYVEFTKIVNEYKKNTPQANADLDDLIPAIQAAYGISKSDFTNYELELLEAALQRTYDTAKHTGQEYILYGGYEPVTVTLCHIVNHRAGLSFTSYSHTGLPVPVYAIGAGAELFDGFYDNTDVYYKLAAITKTSKAKKAA